MANTPPQAQGAPESILLSDHDDPLIDDVFYSTPNIIGLASAKRTDSKKNGREEGLKRVVDQPHEMPTLVTRKSEQPQATISTLPDEVLAYIFYSLKRSAHKEYKGLKKWICVTHVCRRWRKVAVEACPPLWSTITSDYPVAFMKTFFERTKESLLDVKFQTWDMRNQWFGDVLAQIVSKTYRLRSLDLDHRGTRQGMGLGELLGHFTGSPTNLVKLVLKGTRKSVEWTGQRERFHEQEDEKEARLKDFIPDEFLQYDFPALQHFELKGCTIPDSTLWLPKAPGLTRLEIHQTPETNEMPCAERFMDSLKYMPKLKHLDLVNFLPSDKYPAQGSPLELAALRVLKIRGKVEEVCSFFGAVNIPLEASIHVSLLDNPSTPEDSARLLAAISSSWVYAGDANVASPQILSGIQEFQITDINDGFDDDAYDSRDIIHPTLHWWFGPAPAKPRPTADKARLSITFTGQTTASYQAVAGLLRQLDFSQLRCLQVENCASFEDWDIFATVPKLNLIFFRKGKTALRFAEKLKTDPPGYVAPESSFTAVDSDSDSEDFTSSRNGSKKGKKKKDHTLAIPPYFPALKSLVMHDVNFGKHDFASSETVCALVHGFEVRPRGYEIRTMQVKKCTNFAGDDIDFFADSCDVDIQWDRQQIWDREYKEGRRGMGFDDDFGFGGGFW